MLARCARRAPASIAQDGPTSCDLALPPFLSLSTLAPSLSPSTLAKPAAHCCSLSRRAATLPTLSWQRSGPTRAWRLTRKPLKPSSRRRRRLSPRRCVFASVQSTCKFHLSPRCPSTLSPPFFSPPPAAVSPLGHAGAGHALAGHVAALAPRLTAQRSRYACSCLASPAVASGRPT